MAKRVDANQSAIVAALRQCGATVAITSSLGEGFVDIVVGYGGRNYLVEIKDGSQPESAQKLTPDEAKFHEKWRGQVAIIRSVQEAINFLNTSTKVKRKEFEQ
jgi:hypothetical protein